ncbi:response regulator [Hymenobacter sp. 15J16-1T3B]|uniref:response regulator n=1 Tax=Hymenobacter sp. 15J16-1T3B TaxID=2886941 RepID=UPI001D12B853|nr:response regulator [Hymenobacter sp. 15J16-1T3B]MCC3157154.1 response regulator [Hymenobacter sp. 15J16-1T3B]
MSLPACILLVDDDQTTNYLNRLLLKRLAIADELLVAQNGLEALEVLRTHRPQSESGAPVLVFLDVKMPVMDGFEFLQAYEQLPAADKAQTVIVMLTTSLHPHDVERMQQLNIGGFLNKPLTKEKVDAVLQRHFPQPVSAD